MNPYAIRLGWQKPAPEVLKAAVIGLRASASVLESGERLNQGDMTLLASTMAALLRLQVFCMSRMERTKSIQRMYYESCINELKRDALERFWLMPSYQRLAKLQLSTPELEPAINTLKLIASGEAPTLILLGSTLVDAVEHIGVTAMERGVGGGGVYATLGLFRGLERSLQAK